MAKLVLTEQEFSKLMTAVARSESTAARDFLTHGAHGDPLKAPLPWRHLADELTWAIGFTVQVERAERPKADNGPLLTMLRKIVESGYELSLEFRPWSRTTGPVEGIAVSLVERVAGQPVGADRRVVTGELLDYGIDPVHILAENLAMLWARFPANDAAKVGEEAGDGQR